MLTGIHIRKAPGTWVIRAGGAVLGESREALELTEGDMPPVIFFPRADVAMAFLDPSPTRTRVLGLGEAQHFSIHTSDGPIPDAAWSYEHPEPAAERIAGYLTFARGKTAIEPL